MDIIDIIIGFVLNGVLILIFRSILEAAHDRDIARIENDNQKTLAHLNAQLDRSIKIQLTQFASLHERRAHAIVELYKRLAQAEAKLKYAHLPFRIPQPLENENAPWWQRAMNIMRPTTEAVDALVTFYNENKILFTRSVVSKMDQITSITEKLRTSAIMREMQRNSPPDDPEDKEFIDNFVENSLSKASVAYEEAYPQLKEELEAEFRKLLGFDIENSQFSA